MDITPEQAKIGMVKGILDRIEKEPAIEAILTKNLINQEEILKAKQNFHDCYKQIIALNKKFLDMPEDYHKVMALWIVGTYLHEQFNTWPILFFNAMRGSGKTRALKIISTLGHNGDGSVMNNISDAALFRIPPHTTTCIDEIESIGSKEKSTLRELLNASYKKGVKVKRMKKVKQGGEEKYVAEEYEPFIPLAMANIWGLDEVLADRSITLTLEKSDNPGIIKKVENFDKDPYYQGIKANLSCSYVVLCSLCSQKRQEEEWNNYIDDKYNNYTTTHTTYTTLTTSNYTKPEDIELLNLFNKIDAAGIQGRNFELLFPLLQTALLIHEDLFDEILPVIAKMLEIRKSDEYSDSKDVMLYEFISKKPEIRFTPISVKALTIEFRIFTGEGDTDDRWLNEKWMGKALKRLGLIMSKTRQSSGNFVTLDIDKAILKSRIFKKEEVKDEKD